ncbi:MAG: hypothetical protein HOP16_16065 [Acidobacteria bacterium]|nr:hypothetical protein [Acidobacteriota bacterium]
MTVAAGVTAARARGIKRYSASLEDDIFAFQRAAFPTRREDLVEPRWRWMFLSSAARLGVEPMVWMYCNAEGVVAQQGAIPVRVRVGDTERVTGWFVETMTLESVRGKAIGPMLVAKAIQDLPFNLSLGQTPQMRELQFSLGWRQVCPMDTWTFVLNASRVLAGKVPNRPARAIAAAVLAARQRGQYFRGRRRLNWVPEVRVLDRFDATHDRLWETVKAQFPCAVVRDSSYLNWKYVEQPGQDFIRVDIRRGGEPIAAAALLVMEPDHAYGYRRGFIVDLVVPARDADITWVVLDEVRKLFLARSVDLVVFHVVSAPLTRAVESFGFLRREPQRFFLIAPGDMPAPAVALALGQENWLITMGDSDIDRPW